MTRAAGSMSYSVKNAYRDKKSKHLFRLLENNQNLTFKQIATAAGVKLSKVYLINAALENERKLDERKSLEEEKTERVLCQMEARKIRDVERRRQDVERMYFEEGRKISEICYFLFASRSTVINDISIIKNQRGISNDN